MPFKKTVTKKLVVNRSFLRNLADKIYNLKTKKFLHLCDGKLQNGPDPTDENRPMHCGLGELWFAMTGKQPNDRKKGERAVTEARVIDFAVQHSTLTDTKEKLLATVTEALDKLNLDQFRYEVDQKIDAYAEFPKKEELFRHILAMIPEYNDDGCGNDCDLKTFRNRSKRVAAALRKAAAVLPE